MSNKTTAILTFLVSTVIPFIQDVVDFIDMFRTGKYNREGSASLKAISLAMQDDLVNMQKRGYSQLSTPKFCGHRQETNQSTKYDNVDGD